MYSYCTNIVKTKKNDDRSIEKKAPSNGLLKQYRVVYKTSKEESSYIGDIRPSSEEP